MSIPNIDGKEAAARDAFDAPKTPDMPASGMMEPELLPCPFCGSPAAVPKDAAAVYCRNPNCAVRPSSISFTTPMAIAAWNARAIPPDYAKRIAELEGERDLALAKADEPDEASYNEGVEDGKSEVKGVYANLWHSMVHWLSKRKVIDPDADEWTVQDVLAGLAELESDYASTQRSLNRSEAQLTALISLVTEAASALEPFAKYRGDGLAERDIAEFSYILSRLNEAVKP